LSAVNELLFVLSIATEKRYTERKLTLDNLNFCVTRSTRHAKSSSQCRRWNLAGIFRCSCIKNKAANDINASLFAVFGVLPQINLN
jgi:hypothetical protein